MLLRDAVHHSAAGAVKFARIVGSRSCGVVGLLPSIFSSASGRARISRPGRYMLPPYPANAHWGPDRRGIGANRSQRFHRTSCDQCAMFELIRSQTRHAMNRRRTTNVGHEAGNSAFGARLQTMIAPRLEGDRPAGFQSVAGTGGPRAMRCIFSGGALWLHVVSRLATEAVLSPISRGRCVAIRPRGALWGALCLSCGTSPERIAPESLTRCQSDFVHGHMSWRPPTIPPNHVTGRT